MYGMEDTKEKPLTSKDELDKEKYIPKELFVARFKPEWEYFLEKFDNYIIYIFQYFHLKRKDGNKTLNKVLGSIFAGIAFIMTFLTQIENGPSLSIFFIVIGLDFLGEWLMTIGFVVALLAQFPKRFIFRYRPFMQGRALKLSHDKTSSFPSRAVVCSVVYAYAAVICYDYYYAVEHPEGDKPLGVAGVATVIILSAFLSSFSRIHLGVHYPSDCVVGFFFGILICIVSEYVFKVGNIFGCPSCYDNQCYPTDPHYLMDNSNFFP
mmetsp:Transcript_12873/g.11000  ORF Transcript_12873/g.11000 Transcript_12873/m.11000 type:complete len:265 (+) Transcript_12873:67-861(+)